VLSYEPIEVCTNKSESIGDLVNEDSDGTNATAGLELVWAINGLSRGRLGFGQSILRICIECLKYFLVGEIVRGGNMVFSGSWVFGLRHDGQTRPERRESRSQGKRVEMRDEVRKVRLHPLNSNSKLTTGEGATLKETRKQSIAHSVPSSTKLLLPYVNEKLHDPSNLPSFAFVGIYY
jgi:hypothetical protein